MNIENKGQFIEVTAPDGRYVTDINGAFVGSLVYLPLNYNTGNLREVSEEEKNALELMLQDSISNG